MDISQMSIVQIQPLQVQETTHFPPHYDAVLRQSGCSFDSSSTSNIPDEDSRLTQLNIPTQALPPPYIIPLPNGVKDINNPFEITLIQPTHPSFPPHYPSSGTSSGSRCTKPVRVEPLGNTSNENIRNRYTTLNRVDPTKRNLLGCNQQTEPAIQERDKQYCANPPNEDSNVTVFDINSEVDRKALQTVLESMNPDDSTTFWLNIENETEVTAQSHDGTSGQTVTSDRITEKPWDPPASFKAFGKESISGEMFLNGSREQPKVRKTHTVRSYSPNRFQAEHGSERENDILKAAQNLYSKRTRTLWHWINPGIPKTKLKTCVQTAWDNLPEWQKKIYVSQVMGRFGIGIVSPMVNPQIATISDKDKPGPSMEDELKKEMYLEANRGLKRPGRTRRFTRREVQKNCTLNKYLNRDVVDFDEDELFNSLETDDDSDQAYAERNRKRSKHLRKLRKKMKKVGNTEEITNDSKWEKNPEFNDDLFSELKF